MLLAGIVIQNNLVELRALATRGIQNSNLGKNKQIRSIDLILIFKFFLKILILI